MVGDVDVLGHLGGHPLGCWWRIEIVLSDMNQFKWLYSRRDIGILTYCEHITWRTLKDRWWRRKWVVRSYVVLTHEVR